MPNERFLVERVVRRSDDRDGIRALPGGIRRELHGVGRRLSAAVHGHVEAVAGRLDEQARRSFPLLWREEDSLAGRAESEDAVEPARTQKLDVGPERLFVERRPSLAKRRHGGGERSLEHAATLSSRA